MIEKFCKGHHRSVLKIFTEASGDDVSMQPNDIFLFEGGGVKELGVFLKDGE